MQVSTLSSVLISRFHCKPLIYTYVYGNHLIHLLAIVVVVLYKLNATFTGRVKSMIVQLLRNMQAKNYFIIEKTVHFVFHVSTFYH